MKYDFSGFATKNDLKCSDGRIIHKDAFIDQNGEKVPLVWQHMHDSPENVLGHAILENREDGVYAYCFFNDNPSAQTSKVMVQHGDISYMSIYANNLVEKNNSVLHGSIREVSLVLAGANPGAVIDNIAFSHSDGGSTIDETEAIIYTGETLMHYEDSSEDDPESDDQPKNEKTAQEVFDSMTEEQQNVTVALVAEALNEKKNPEEDADSEEDLEHSNIGGNSTMKKNVFDNTVNKARTLTHSETQVIISDAVKNGSLKDSVLTHAATYGIDNIEILFPDAQAVTNEPFMIDRDQSWVGSFLSATKKTPFSRIKSTSADITADEARAKGYTKGGKKIEEVFSVAKRITTPTTVYKKQKLDRDDVIDITELNVVSFVKGEMRGKLNEELARAATIGDGRAVDHADKINEENIRPIYKDHAFYVTRKELAADATTEDKIDMVVKARKDYKGTGTPNFYTTVDEVTDMLLLKDKNGRRIYPTLAELKAALRVADIIEVELFEGVENDDKALVGMLFNPIDYVFGANKGGEVSMFDDFDIDFNQYKYLLETRCCGALIKPKSAVVLEQLTVGG